MAYPRAQLLSELRSDADASVVSSRGPRDSTLVVSRASALEGARGGMRSFPGAVDGLGVRFPSALLANRSADSTAVLQAYFADLPVPPGPTTVFSGLLIEMEDLSQGEVPVQFLMEPIEFVLPTNYSVGMECAFWHEETKDWSTAGVSVSPKSKVGEWIVCLTTHLSLFAAIARGFVETLACANLGILNWAAVLQIFTDVEWAGEPGSGLLFLVAFCLFAAMIAAAALDGWRKANYKWRDDFFLVMAIDEEDPENSGTAVSAVTGCTAGCGQCLGSSGALREALDDIMSGWFEYFSEVRGLCETMMGSVTVSDAASKATQRLLVLSGRRTATVAMGLSEEVTDFVLEDEGLVKFLMDQHVEEAPQTPAATRAATTSRNGEWRYATEQYAAWRMLHEEVSHHVLAHTTKLDTHWLLACISAHFLTQSPLATLFSFDVFRSSKQRVVALVCDIIGALAF